EYALGISGPDGAEANPFDSFRSRPFPTGPHRFNGASLAIKRGTEKLGLHLVREPVTLPTSSWEGRPACVGAGVCNFGCKISAKSSIDVTYIPRGEATGRMHLLASCMARELTVSPDGRVKSAIYFDSEGKEQEINARAFVVAGNAVETPRLLLLSKS